MIHFPNPFIVIYCHSWGISHQVWSKWVNKRIKERLKERKWRLSLNLSHYLVLKAGFHVIFCQTFILSWPPDGKECGRIVELHKQGLSQSAIAAEVGWGKVILNFLKDPEGYGTKKSSGRPKTNSSIMGQYQQLKVMEDFHHPFIYVFLLGKVALYPLSCSSLKNTYTAS